MNLKIVVLVLSLFVSFPAQSYEGSISCGKNLSAGSNLWSKATNRSTLMNSTEVDKLVCTAERSNGYVYVYGDNNTSYARLDFDFQGWTNSSNVR